MNWYILALKRYAEFDGRSRRMEYWMFFLFNFIISCVLTAVDIFVLTPLIGLGVLSLIYSLGVLVPNIAVTVRRLHDTNRSGWWFLIVLIPLIGWLILLVFMVLDGESGENRFGPDPKTQAA